MSARYQWKVVIWDSGWGGKGKTVDGKVFALADCLTRLEDEGWEIFQLNRPYRTMDYEIVVRKPR